MACLVAPLTEAIVVSVAESIYNKKSKADEVVKTAHNERIKILTKMLYGGSFLLAVEHIYHGEITFKFPFLTAVENGETIEMLKEIATSGVAMAVLVTSVWAIGCLVAKIVKGRPKMEAAV